MDSQLIYVSNRDKNCDDKEIAKILDSCKRNNPDFGITGVLLYNDNKFVQVVEGKLTTLLQLYDKIKLDKRHNNPILISCGPINKKSFPSWHMASRKIEDNYGTNFKTEISTEDKLTFEKLFAGKENDSEKILKIITKFFDN